MKTRRLKKSHNVTKKNVCSVKKLQTLCKVHSNAFNSFEKEYDKINVETISFDTKILTNKKL